MDNRFRHNILLIFVMIFSIIAIPSYALTFAIQPNSDIVGVIQTATVQNNESLADIGRKFDIGIYEMIESNPDVDPWRPAAKTSIIIPSQFVLPPGKRQGIIINLAEMRIYYFHPNKLLVSTHPLGIGRKGWETPLGSGYVTQKQELPHWIPPKSIREEYDKRGKYLPQIVPPGPKNPLGKYSMRLSIPGYLIHGTNRTGGIGVRSSSGCVRMYPEDIQSLFNKVAVGTKVEIIHYPYKIGRHLGKIYLEAHEPLSDDYYNVLSEPENFAEALQAAKIELGGLDWGVAQKAIHSSQGYPILIQ